MKEAVVFLAEPGSDVVSVLHLIYCRESEAFRIWLCFREAVICVCLERSLLELLVALL